MLFYPVFHRSEFSDERIPTLYEAVELCKELDLVMFLDAKDDNEEVLNVYMTVIYCDVILSCRA